MVRGSRSCLARRARVGGGGRATSNSRSPSGIEIRQCRARRRIAALPDRQIEAVIAAFARHQGHATAFRMRWCLPIPMSRPAARSTPANVFPGRSGARKGVGLFCGARAAAVGPGTTRGRSRGRKSRTYSDGLQPSGINIPVHGHFDQETRKVVEAFQGGISARLRVDGEADFFDPRYVGHAERCGAPTGRLKGAKPYSRSSKVTGHDMFGANSMSDPRPSLPGASV